MHFYQLNSDVLSYLYSHLSHTSLVNFQATCQSVNNHMTEKQTEIWQNLFERTWPHTRLILPPDANYLEAFKWETIRERNWRKGIYTMETIFKADQTKKISQTALSPKWLMTAFEDAVFYVDRVSKEGIDLSGPLFSSLRQGSSLHLAALDDDLLALSSTGQLRVYDLEAQTCLINYDHPNALTALTVKGSLVGFGSRTGEIGLSSCHNRGKVIRAHRGAVKSIQFGFQGDTALSMSGNELTQWDLQTFTGKKIYQRRSRIKSFIQINPSLLAIGTLKGELRLKDCRSPTPSSLIQDAYSVSCLNPVSPHTFISSADKTIHLWDVRQLKDPVLTREAPETITCLQADEEKVVYGDYSGKISVTSYKEPEKTYTLDSMNCEENIQEYESAVKDLHFETTELIASFHNGKVQHWEF